MFNFTEGLIVLLIVLILFGPTLIPKLKRMITDTLHQYRRGRNETGQETQDDEEPVLLYAASPEELEAASRQGTSGSGAFRPGAWWRRR